MNSSRAERSDLLSAEHLISLIDLTNLDDDCTLADVEALCASAIEHFVAGVCIWPDFVAAAAEILAERTAAIQTSAARPGSSERVWRPIDVVTVVNFPTGDERPLAIEAVTNRCIADGATEIDVVLPYRRFLAGDIEWCREILDRVRTVTAPDVAMKVILETGELMSATAISAAAELAITAGADFVKSSTGKSAVSATPEAVELLAAAVAASGRPVGIKPSGGIRTSAQARDYLAVVVSQLGDDWASPDLFRFGASGLLQTLLNET